MKKNQIIDLLNEMTIDEKIGQMIQIRGDIFCKNNDDISTGPIDIESELSEKILYNVGSLLNNAGSKKIKEIQHNYLKKNRLKIPLLFMADIIHGYKTIFPSPLAQGCSWNTEVIRKMTEISSKESAFAGINVVFAPMVDLVRDARWGRCMESIGGEDPYLAETYVKTIVKEFSKRQISCVKHFAAYGAVEAGRDYNTVDISEREFRNNYSRGYKSAIDNGSKMIMTSFNILNGVPATINKWLLKDILRKEWNFDGVVITDYNAIQECIKHGAVINEREACLKAIEAGVDIDMMSLCYANNLKKLVEENKISIKKIDEAVLRILTLKNEQGLFENPYGKSDEDQEKKYILSSENLTEATKLTEETFVLLKNNNNLLPINQNDFNKIAIIGPYADNREMLSSWTIFGKKENTETLKEVFDRKIGKDKVLYSKGCEILEEKELEDLLSIQNKDVIKNKRKFCQQNNLEDIAKIAKEADVIILAVGEHYLQSGEGCSRTNLKLPKIQLELIDELYKLRKPMIGLIFNGRPLQLQDIEKKFNSILDVWMPGTKGAEAIFNVLFGKTNPSGKLIMSFPYTVGQCPIYYNHYNTGRPNENRYRYESRYLDVPTGSLYPFGFGLSYSKFVYSNLKLDNKILKENSKIIVTLKVKNESDIAGKETIQLYIQDLVGSVVRPVKELKSFKKEYFLPHEEKMIKFEITKDMLKFWNYEMNYVAENGIFKVFVGKNSEETLEETFELTD